MGDVAVAELVRLVAMEPVRLCGAPTARDIRAMLKAAVDDPVFAKLDQAKLCVLLFEVRCLLRSSDDMVYHFDKKARRRDQAAFRGNLIRTLKMFDGLYAGELLRTMGDAYAIDWLEDFRQRVHHLLDVSDAIFDGDVATQPQHRTMQRGLEIHLMDEMMREVAGAPVSISGDCPRLTLMGRLMKYTSGRAVDADTLKTSIVRMRANPNSRYPPGTGSMH